MKKVLCFFFAMLLVFLCSCSGDDSSTTITTTTATTTPDPIPIISDPSPFLMLNDLDEYNSFLREKGEEVPAHFVRYEQLSLFGEFLEFAFALGDATRSEGSLDFDIIRYKKYSYSFFIELQKPFVCLSIHYDNSLERGKIAAQSSPAGNDLRQNSVDGYCEISGMWYDYKDKMLTTIAWQHGAYCFYLTCPNRSMMEWNLEENTLFIDFLKADTCQQAKETLMASIFGTE